MGNKIHNILKLLICTLICLNSAIACSQQKQDNNIKWISKFDFLDLYKVKVNSGYFNPGSAIRLSKIIIPSENVILLAGAKDENSFDASKKGDVAILFASNDKGKTYKEILLNDDMFLYIESTPQFSLIESYTTNKEGIKVHKVQLLDIKTLKLTIIDEFMETSNISYDYFDGKYVIKTGNADAVLMNVFDKNEKYIVSKEILEKKRLHNNGEGKFIYMENREIIQFDVKLKAEKVIQKLKNKYDYLWAEEDVLVKKDDNSQKLEIFDLNENKIYELDNENRNFYRYKNFMCDYRKIGVKPEIRYSYDYGKTWKTHHVQGFTILQNIFGFYKDQLLVTEGIFFKGDSPESGGRIMVGQFVK